MKQLRNESSLLRLMLVRQIECFYDVPKTKTFLPLTRHSHAEERKLGRIAMQPKTTIIGDKWSWKLRSDASQGRFRDFKIYDSIWFTLRRLMENSENCKTRERRKQIWLTVSWKARVNFPLGSFSVIDGHEKKFSRFNFISTEKIFAFDVEGASKRKIYERREN